MTKTDKKEKACVLENFKIERLDETNIINNKNKIFDAWKNVWKGSGWGREDIFILDESINYITEIANEGFVYQIEKNSQIIAFAMATIQHFPKPKNPREDQIYQNAKNVLKSPAFFHELAIIENYRNQGLGGALMNMLEQKVQTSGADGVFLWTRKDSSSKNLYKRLGYKIVGKTTVPRDNTVGKEDRIYFLKSFLHIK